MKNNQFLNAKNSQSSEGMWLDIVLLLAWAISGFQNRYQNKVYKMCKILNKI